MRLVAPFAYLAIQATAGAALPLLTAVTALHRLVAAPLLHVSRKLALKAGKVGAFLHKSRCAVQGQPRVVRNGLALGAARDHVFTGAAALRRHVVARLALARSSIFILELVGLPVSAQAPSVFNC